MLMSVYIHVQFIAEFAWAKSQSSPATEALSKVAYKQQFKKLGNIFQVLILDHFDREIYAIP